MKRIIILMYVIILVFVSIDKLNATFTECKPRWDWDWSITNNCSWPSWYMLYGDLSVWNHTIEVWTWVDMWIDLSVNKITFSDSSISRLLINSTAKVSNHVIKRFYKTYTFSSWWYGWISAYWPCTAVDDDWCYGELSSTITECESWMNVFYHQVVPTDPATHYMIADGTDVYVGTSGNMYCWVR